MGWGEQRASVLTLLDFTYVTLLSYYKDTRKGLARLFKKIKERPCRGASAQLPAAKLGACALPTSGGLGAWLTRMLTLRRLRTAHAFS